MTKGWHCWESVNLEASTPPQPGYMPMPLRPTRNSPTI